MKHAFQSLSTGAARYPAPGGGTHSTAACRKKRVIITTTTPPPPPITAAATRSPPSQSTHSRAPGRWWTMVPSREASRRRGVRDAFTPRRAAATQTSSRPGPRRRDVVDKTRTCTSSTSPRGSATRSNTSSSVSPRNSASFGGAASRLVETQFDPVLHAFQL